MHATHPSTNQARRQHRVTTLVETNVLPLSQANGMRSQANGMRSQANGLSNKYFVHVSAEM